MSQFHVASLAALFTLMGIISNPALAKPVVGQEYGMICPSKEQMQKAPMNVVYKVCDRNDSNCKPKELLCKEGKCNRYLATGITRDESDSYWLNISGEFQVENLLGKINGKSDKDAKTIIHDDIYQQGKDFVKKAGDPFIMELNGRGFCMYKLTASSTKLDAIMSVRCLNSNCQDVDVNLMRRIIIH